MRRISFVFAVDDFNVEEIGIFVKQIVKLVEVSHKQTRHGITLSLVFLEFGKSGLGGYNDPCGTFVHVILDVGCVTQFHRVDDEHRHGGESSAENVVPGITVSGVPRFLEAVVITAASVKYDLCHRGSTLDLSDLHFGVGLSVTDFLFLVLLGFVLEDVDLGSLAVGKNFGGDFSSGNGRSTDAEVSVCG